MCLSACAGRRMAVAASMDQVWTPYGSTDVKVERFMPADLSAVQDHAQSSENGSAPLLPLAIRTRPALYEAWIPILKGGGLFVQTSKSYALGEEVVVLLTLWDSPAKFPLQGRVAWMNFAGCSGGRPEGIGIQLADSDASREIKRKIEGALAGAASSSRLTHTV